jgi:DNA-binding PadR family transcriptional regulator
MASRPRAAGDIPIPPPRDRRRGPGTSDPLLGDLRRSGLLTLLVLHYVSQGPCYGHQLMDPLLRSLEERNLIVGEWEHTDRRSRHFYRITGAGQDERARLLGQVSPRLDAVAAAIDAIRRELLGT